MVYFFVFFCLVGFIRGNNRRVFYSLGGFREDRVGGFSARFG